MTCTCISCDECGGSGNVWVSFTGKYLGRSRCDDLDDLETCEECSGSGFFEMCDECLEKEEQAEFEEYKAAEAAEQSVHPTGLMPRQKEEVEQIVKSVINSGIANPPCG
jgi:hypothetical protein